MARRRSAEEIAATLDERSAKLKADADRRRSVASDGLCSLLYEAEKAVRNLAGYVGTDNGKPRYTAMADELQVDREERWRELKSREAKS